MCDFISIGVHRKLTPALQKWRRRGYALVEYEHPTLIKTLPDSHVPWLLTTGGCSCDLCKPLDAVGKGKAKHAFHLREDATSIIRELVELNDGRAFLYVHTYEGDLSTESLPIVKRTHRTPASVSSPTDPLMRDELIELTTRFDRHIGES